MSDGLLPIFLCEVVDKGRQVTFWCPFCVTFHTHSADHARHVLHCPSEAGRAAMPGGYTLLFNERSTRLCSMKIRTRGCEFCGETFRIGIGGSRTDRRTCSNSCRVQLSRRKRDAAAIVREMVRP